ncbi:MAG TPA: AAA family ATPase [Caldilineaceae bacterium]|nr:AAA family ATPase [Caldilineaceae bacterium]
MRVREIRISGFKSIAFCAGLQPAAGGAGGVREGVQLEWDATCFRLQLPAATEPGRPLLYAIMGANSAGKSNILLALDTFFGPAVKLDAGFFNGKRSDQPLIIELTLEGSLPTHPTAWHALNCLPADGPAVACAGWRLTVASVWRGDGRTRYIRRSDGLYYRQNQADRAQVERLLPEFRAIWADRRLADEASLERRSLLSDVLEAMLAQAAGEDSIIRRAARLMAELQRLLADRADPSLWAPVHALEASLARGLAAVTPQRQAVRLRLERGLPTLPRLLAQGAMSLDDGVELDFAQHGLGVQRSFALAALNTWCEYRRDAQRDYLFAVEEPEIYLHPHATRVLLNLLEKVARHDQVVFTTHASEFINRVPLGQIVTVRRQDQAGQVSSRAVHPDLQGIAPEEVAKVQRYLREDRSDMLFARAVLLVEGQAEYFALPAFARTLGLDLDAGGVSIVFVNGIGNFAVYHRILAAFQIPHVILMDGDGQAPARRRQYAHLADALFVLEHDFEHLLVEALSHSRLLALLNECLARRGRPAQTRLGDPRRRAAALAALGKPLVGRVAGELLDADEVAAMPPLVNALRAVLQLGATCGPS